MKNQVFLLAVLLGLAQASLKGLLDRKKKKSLSSPESLSSIEKELK